MKDQELGAEDIGLKTSGLGLKIRKLRAEDVGYKNPSARFLQPVFFSPFSSARFLQPNTFILELYEITNFTFAWILFFWTGRCLYG